MSNISTVLQLARHFKMFNLFIRIIQSNRKTKSKAISLASSSIQHINSCFFPNFFEQFIKFPWSPIKIILSFKYKRNCLQRCAALKKTYLKLFFKPNLSQCFTEISCFLYFCRSRRNQSFDLFCRSIDWFPLGCKNKESVKFQ